MKDLLRKTSRLWARVTPPPLARRYLAGMFMRRIALIAFVLLTTLQTLDLVGESNELLAAPGAGLSSLATYVQLRMPALASQFLPFIILLAALATFGALRSRQEVIALGAAALSPLQIAAPLMMVGAGISLIHLVAHETIVVPTSMRLADWQAADYAAVAAEIEAPSPMQWIAFEAGYIGSRAAPASAGDASRMTEVIVVNVAAEALQSVVMAGSARIAGASGQLIDVRRYDIRPGTLERIGHLAFDAGLLDASLQSRPLRTEFATLAELRRAGFQPWRGESAGRQLQTTLFHRLAAPFASTVMPLLASLAAFGLVRGGSFLPRAAASLALGFGYFVLDAVCVALAQSGSVPPPLGAFSALLITTLAGLWALASAYERA